MDHEADLVHRAQRDPEAFGVLYDRYVDRIYRYLLGRTGHVQTAEDLTAETFLAALKGLWRYRWTGKPFAAWLYRIAGAKIGDHYRGERVRTVELELAAARPSPPPEFPADYATLHAALAELNPPQREALALRYFEDLSLADIAWVMRLPVNTVKSHLRRGLERLHRLLDSETYAATAEPKTRSAFAPRGAAH